jgi:large subunit ribosomal protein L13
MLFSLIWSRMFLSPRATDRVRPFSRHEDLRSQAHRPRDFVVVINAEKIAVTGKKRTDKRYYRHSGYPGGLRSRTFEEMIDRRPEEIIRLAVKGMLPRNRLARKQITKLKVYAGPEHPHVAQKPQQMEIEA